MAGTFLQRSRHGTVWYFRRRIPDDLRSIVGHPYLVQSLRTEQRREAVIRARQLGVKTDTFFEELRSGMGKSRDTIRIDFALESFLDEFGKRTAKATDVQPGEHVDAAIAVAALQAQFDGAPLPVATTPAPMEKPFGMRFEDAIEDYLKQRVFLVLILTFDISKSAALPRMRITSRKRFPHTTASGLRSASF